MLHDGLYEQVISKQLDCALSETDKLSHPSSARQIVLSTVLEAERHLLAAYPELSGMYQPGDGNNEVFRLDDVTATFSSFTEPPRVLKFILCSVHVTSIMEN